MVFEGSFWYSWIFERNREYMDVDAEDLNIWDTKIQACCGYFRRPERERLYRIIGFLRIDFNILDVLKETDRTGNICLGDSILRQRQNRKTYVRCIFSWIRWEHQTCQFVPEAFEAHSEHSLAPLTDRFWFSWLFERNRKEDMGKCQWSFKTEANTKTWYFHGRFRNRGRIANISFRSQRFLRLSPNTPWY